MASVPHNFAPPTRGCRIDRKPGLIEAQLDSDPSHLSAVRTAIESLSTEAGFDAKSTGEIGLVVNEALANVMRHAYGSAKDMPILVRAEVKSDTIEITMRDWGHGRVPAAPGKLKPPEALSPGGLGLICMHNLMDQILFTPQERGMLLTMRRSRPVKGAG